MTVRTLVVALVGIVSLAACGGSSTPSPAPPAGEIPADNATDAPLLPTYADTLPEMDPAGFERLLGQLEGTPVLVNFWGEWCPPCREEMPRLVAAHEEWGDRVQFVGVDILDSRGAARSFMDEFGMTFPSVFDPPDAIKTSLGLFGQPVTAFYRPDGSLEFAWTGPISEETLREHLETIAG
jgi:cytochrome c biogenesis protein CcmG/thiol:disulfide interchange protein DsbE